MARAKFPVVYSMGKVGSSGLVFALKEAGLHCAHIHTLRREALLHHAKAAIEDGQFPPPHVCESMAHVKLFRNPRRCIYITGVREPISRNLSAFFQNLGAFDPKALADKDARTAFKKFIDDYPHDQALDWFDRELRDCVGLDVYARTFDRKARYSSLHKQLYVFRIDCPAETIEAELSAVFNRPVKIQMHNASSTKDYGAAYNAVKEIAAFSPSFLDRMYDSKYARHFWTDEELTGFRSRWLSSELSPASGASAF